LFTIPPPPASWSTPIGKMLKDNATAQQVQLG
jgi:hypothetical protein